MSVTSVTRMPGRRLDETGNEGTFPLKFRVVVDDADDQAPEALSDVRIPKYGDLLISWEAFGNAHRFRCIHREALDRPGSPMVFDVTCEFSTNLGDTELEKAIARSQRRATVEMSSRKATIPLLFWQDGSAVQNTAGDNFVPTLETSIRESVYSVGFAVFKPKGWMYSHELWTNSMPFRIRGITWPQYTLLLDSVSVGDETWNQGDLIYDVKVSLIGVTGDIEVGSGARTHKRLILNDGMFEIAASKYVGRGKSTAKKRRCMKGGQPSEVPMPLDESGMQIPEQELIDDPINAPHYLEDHEFPSIAFNTILPSLA